MSSRTVKSNYSQLSGEVPLNIKGTASIAASLASGSQVYLKFVPDPTQPSVSTTALQVPPDEAWVVFDVYSPVQTPAVDGYITFNVNRKPQNITFGPLSATYKNVFGFLEVSSAISANPNSQIQSLFVTDTANGTIATTVTVNMRIKRVPSGYTGKLVL
jgi:hypothetical protein